MENKENYIDKYGKLLTVIMFRPRYQSIALAVVGAAMIIYFQNGFGYSVGGFMFATGLLSLLSKDHRVGELYERGVVIYDDKGIEPIQDFPYTSVVQWNIGLGRENCICFFLDDNTQSSFPSFSYNKAERILRKVMPDKNSKDIIRKENAMKARKKTATKK